MPRVTRLAMPRVTRPATQPVTRQQPGQLATRRVPLGSALRPAWPARRLGLPERLAHRRPAPAGRSTTRQSRRHEHFEIDVDLAPAGATSYGRACGLLPFVPIVVVPRHRRRDALAGVARS